MHCLVASAGPTCAPLQPQRVVGTTDHNRAAGFDLLEMTLQTQVTIAFGKHLVVNAAMGIVARDASLAHSLMLKSKGPPLVRVTFRAPLVLPEQPHAARQMGAAFVR